MAQEFDDQLISFMPKMRVWALALTRNRAAADDLTQDVATKVLIARNCFIPRNKLLRLGSPYHDQSFHQQRA